MKKQREDVHLLWPWRWRQRSWAGPLEVTLTRVSPARGRLLDDDNLQGALKAIRDEVASQLGFLDDGDTNEIRFRYRQERGDWGVRVDIKEGTP